MATKKATGTNGEKKVALIKDYRMLRAKLHLNQTEFWNRIGVTQSGGCRYESGRKPPKAVAVLAHLVYIKGEEIDARGFK
jgi:DNA-binding transcriptional regulator YiaG